MARDKRLRDQYNISADEYDTILAFQGGVCPICKEATVRAGKRKGLPKLLNVDHNHKTGLTRGVLCSYDNRKITEYWTIEKLERVLDFLKNPPATAALGEERYGRKGRVTNKRPRKRKRGKL